ncbi:MAG: hypothetical protein QOF56_1210, partial [Acidobacteriaceae bacterium]|nr:hypothetical protein [Acidobacteriaceae bacterium]
QNSTDRSGGRVRPVYRSAFVGCEEKSSTGEQENMIRKRAIAMILAVLVIASEAMAKAARTLTWLH